ncbi:SIR2 family protein [Azospirillum brasilense]|uniref:SIR2 family protein n=1 Tax=Azospirillum argentinense TaxID=2970906 RepID=UPI00190EDBCE|nr:SIR2 family protein [Azospirillum argentinense]MBK3801719.1 SIR2 family protein [Azospirillum argentinense]
MEIHDLKLLLQHHLTDGLVTVVGSGLSCAEGLPGMGELATHLDASVTSGLGGADIDRWNAISPLLPTKGLESALLAVPPTPGLESAIVARTAELISERERTIVSEVFSRKRTLRFTRLVRQILKPPSGIPIITTNYDRLIEIAVEEAGLGVDTLFIGNFAGELNEQESRLSFCREVTIKAARVQYRYRPRANVFKPHRSLDWYHRAEKPVRYSGNLDLQRLIITPGLNKFRNGYESPFDRHRERANSAIDRANRFLVIGYGFNDDHLETHLTPRIRNGVPTLLLTYSLSDNAVKLVKECSNIIAIQFTKKGGVAGSGVFISGVETFFPKIDLWDLGSFVSEVLEP